MMKAKVMKTKIKQSRADAKAERAAAKAEKQKAALAKRKEQKERAKSKAGQTCTTLALHKSSKHTKPKQTKPKNTMAEEIDGFTVDKRKKPVHENDESGGEDDSSEESDGATTDRGKKRQFELAYEELPDHIKEMLETLSVIIWGPRSGVMFC